MVKTVAVGSGQAIEMGEKGDADVLLVHSPDDEEEFMAGGHGSSPVRRSCTTTSCWWDPPEDPAKVSRGRPTPPRR